MGVRIDPATGLAAPAEVPYLGRESLLDQTALAAGTAIDDAGVVEARVKEAAYSYRYHVWEEASKACVRV